MLKRNIVRCYSDLKLNVPLRNCIRSLRSQDLYIFVRIRKKSPSLQGDFWSWVVLRFTWHTDSFPYLLSLTSYLSDPLSLISHLSDLLSLIPYPLSLTIPTPTPLWRVYPYCTNTIYTARYPSVTLAWSYSNMLKPQVYTRSPRWRIRWYTR